MFGRAPKAALRAARGLAYEPGHFYSPIVDAERRRRARSGSGRRGPSWPRSTSTTTAHQRVLTEWFPRFMPDYDYPEHLDEHDAPAAFYTQNSQFSWLDSRALFVLLRAWQPKRIIEVGSGYSSLLIADVNRRFLGGRHRLHVHRAVSARVPQARRTTASDG